jgi:hypothetical protein
MSIHKAVDESNSPLVLNLEAKSGSFEGLQAYWLDAARAIEHLEESQKLPIKRSG